MGGLEFQHGAPSGPEQPSGHELAVAGFYGSMPVHDAGGNRANQGRMMGLQDFKCRLTFLVPACG